MLPTIFSCTPLRESFLNFFFFFCSISHNNSLLSMHVVDMETTPPFLHIYIYAFHFVPTKHGANIRYRLCCMPIQIFATLQK